MGYLSLLANLGVIIDLVKSVEGFVGLVVKNKSLPVEGDPAVRDLLDQVRRLLDSGVIQIAGVDDKAVSAALALIEEKICGPKNPS